ncbi:unnamed protein product [Ectocarpus sp. 6 AP-2014]
MIMKALVLASAVPAAAAAAADASSAAVNLRPESELTSNCFDFPRNGFDRQRSIKGAFGQSPKLLLETGSGAIDFTSHDYPAGERWNLREHLEGVDGDAGKPVVLIWGMFTCPAFQGMGDQPPIPPWDKCGYRDEYDLVEMYKDHVTFVHLYGPEPHPTTPATNFDHGVVVNSYWSTVPQPESYEQRLAMVDRVKDLMHPEQAIIPDYMPGNPYSELINPLWCSYGLGARPATAIAQDGTIFYQQEWLHTGDLADELDVFLEGGGDPDAAAASGGGRGRAGATQHKHGSLGSASRSSVLPAQGLKRT